MKAKDIEFVRLQNASLDEKDNDIVAHGWLDIESIKKLLIGDYQREVLSISSGRVSPIRRALEENVRLPDIVLGMRGENYSTRGQTMLLEDDVYVIDGLQRTSAMKAFALANPDKAADLRIGAEVRFSTDRESENKLFIALNVNRRAMSPNVLLRNARTESVAIATLYGLSTADRNSPIYGKIGWSQQMGKEHLTTSLSLAKSAASLHRQYGAGKHITNVAFVIKSLDSMASAIGLNNFRSNVSAFYEVIDSVWGIRNVRHNERQTHMRTNFLNQLAGVFSDHEDFWQGNRLVVDASFRNKLKTFPLDDPSIQRLASAGNTAGMLLYRHIIDHMNRSKQASRHLTMREIIPRHNGGRKKKKEGTLL